MRQNAYLLININENYSNDGNRERYDIARMGERANALRKSAPFGWRSLAGFEHTLDKKSSERLRLGTQ
jgi:hypothetical protein